MFAPYGLYWRQMRKLCALELLSDVKIGHFRGMRKSEVGLMVESIKQAGQRSQVVDLSAIISDVSRDMNCLMIFSRKFADDELDATGFKSVVMETMAIGAKFNIADYFPYVSRLDLQGFNRRLKRLSKILDEFLEKIIDDHVQNKDVRKEYQDFVDTIMGIMESKEAPFEFDRRHVKAVLLDLLITGMDTSSTAIEWTMSELLRHPHVMKKLQLELESVVGTNHMVEELHLDKLKYLDCVIKEAQRLHPVAPLLIPHESMEDCIVDGFHVPKKSTVLVNVWAIGRDPQVWPNPEMFSPERFFGTEIDLLGHDFQLIPFGSGRDVVPDSN